MRIGFIGLGTMGASMAANLQKAGYELVVNDIRRASADGHIAQGATWAATPRAVAEAADVVFTSLPGPPEVEAVALGADGLLAGMRKDAACFDLSTNSPTRWCAASTPSSPRRASTCSTRRSAAGRAAPRRARWRSGSAATRRSFDRHKAVLDAMGDQARYIGPIGAGSVAKLVHNCAGYACRRRWPRCSRWASRAVSSRWRCGRRCAPAPAAGGAPSTP